MCFADAHTPAFLWTTRSCGGCDETLFFGPNKIVNLGKRMIIPFYVQYISGNVYG